MKHRTEGFDLLHQPLGQLLPRNDGKSRNVIDRLLGIELGALAARAVEDIDDVCLDIEKAELKNGKETARPCSDNDGIRFDRRRCLAVNGCNWLRLVHSDRPLKTIYQ